MPLLSGSNFKMNGSRATINSKVAYACLVRKIVEKKVNERGVVALQED